MAYDVVTFGETMLRYTPPQALRVEQATTLQIHVGGSESNTSVGLARLGLRVCWLSRLTDNGLGRLIAGTLARYGVDTSRVVWTPDDRVGTYYLEEAQPPRPANVIYDRARSAFSRITPDDIPDDLFASGGARLLHLTGINAAVGVGAAARRVLELAKAAGCLVSFDVNHRSKLLAANEALPHYEPFMQAADMLFVPKGDAGSVCGASGTPDEMITQLAARYPARVIVMTMGADGALAAFGGEIYHQPIFEATAVDRLGRGDAFSAGFLYRMLTTDWDIASGLRWGAALAALKYTIPGDMPLVDRAQVAALAEGGESGAFR